MKKTKLKELVFIKTGLVLGRKKATFDSKTTRNYKTISLKSFNENGSYDHSFADDFKANEEIKKENLLQKGDILIRLREPNIAVYIDKDYEYTIISSLAAVIRVNKDTIDPFYLTSYLNSSFIKRQFLSQSSTIPMVNIKELGELEILLPSRQKQDEIVNFQQLAYKEIKLLQNLIKQKQNYLNKIFETTIKKDIKNG
ncbi:restriction endonuclease subunit S [Campylobacter pinnipediorum]|uniref:restriction endonuclease subunit S n=1 Tax=Campylobacter pinnipediorum TaxID=1965231 RepID=UPI00084D4E90|nr:restriction endonuclease subunit S [Campylobacter pinnipediorum]